ncbi:MAG: recombination-associated protein RdgC [Neisseriaceae bacterium]|nr:MAG: recombination-associated protein RdgC [Neisseriaceae bacterium]
MKWFKQLSVVLINPESFPSINVVEEKLTQHNIPLMMGLSKDVQGFVPAYSFTEQMIFPIENSWKMRLKKEEKLLPSYIVNDELAVRIESVEKVEYRKISSREKREMKQSIIDDLLPKAFIKQSFIEALYNGTNGFLLIDQANESKRERFISELREALGGLQVTLLNTKMSVTTLMTTWLRRGYAERNFTLDNFCELKSVSDTSSAIKFYKCDLLAHEIQDIVENDRFVSQLALVWNDKIRFLLCHDFTLKNIRFIDMQVSDESDYDSDDSHSEIMLVSANQMMMSSYFSQIYEELIEHAGGLIED